MDDVLAVFQEASAAKPTAMRRQRTSIFGGPSSRDCVTDWLDVSGGVALRKTDAKSYREYVALSAAATLADHREQARALSGLR